MSLPRRIRSLVPVALLGCSAAQGGAGFELSYPASTAPTVEAIAARVRAAPEPVLPAVVVLTPAPPAQGFAVFDLPSGRRLGQVGTAVDGRPVVVGDLVVAHTRGAVVAWSLEGAERWRIPDDGLGLDGAARDGDRAVLALGGNGVTQRDGALVVVNAASGATALRLRVSHALGVPAVAGDLAFIPWDGQNLSVFDLAAEREVARLRSRDDVYSFARREGPAVYFGARALYRLAPADATGRRDVAPHWLPTRDDVPGGPPLVREGYTAQRGGVDARERVRLAWRPDPSADGVALTDGTVYALFYRDVFALDAATGAVRWAYVHPVDFAGIEPVRGGVALADVHGAALFLDAARGQVLWRSELGAPAVQAVFQLGAGFAPPSSNAGPLPAPGAGLVEAASGTDARLLPAQLFAVRSLAAVEGPDATRALVAIVTDRALPQDLRAAAGDALARRTTGMDSAIEALEAHYDYVRQTAAPPVGLLARALASAHDRRGVPALVAHLRDPATPIGDLAPLVSALRELADPVALPALVDFVRLYHADLGPVPPVGGGDPVEDRAEVDQDALNTALEQAIEAIARMGTPPELAALDALLADPNTPQPVRILVARVRSGNPGPVTTGASTVTTTADAAGDHPGDHPGDQHPDEPSTFGLPPSHLGPDVIAEAFAPQRLALLRCLVGASSRPAQVRIQFWYESDGHISHVVVAPTQFQACMAPLVEHIQLPVSQVGREIGTYNLSGLAQ